jgi:hypothetical protein
MDSKHTLTDEDKMHPTHKIQEKIGKIFGEAEIRE